MPNASDGVEPVLSVFPRPAGASVFEGCWELWVAGFGVEVRLPVLYATRTQALGAAERVYEALRDGHEKLWERYLLTQAC